MLNVNAAKLIVCVLLLATAGCSSLKHTKPADAFVAAVAVEEPAKEVTIVEVPTVLAMPADRSIRQRGHLRSEPCLAGLDTPASARRLIDHAGPAARGGCGRQRWLN